MGDGVRDSNQVVAALGSLSGVATPLKVDHTTGYLKLSITIGTLSAPTTRTNANHDDNNVPTTNLTYNGSSSPLLADHTTGYVCASVTIS